VESEYGKVIKYFHNDASTYWSKKSFLLNNEEPSRNPTTCFAGHQGFAEPMLKNTELDYISTHTQKSILTSINPTTHWLDLHRNVFQNQQTLLLAGTKPKSAYESLELTTATRLPTAIHRTPSSITPLLAAISKRQFIFASEVMNLILNLLASTDKIVQQRSSSLVAGYDAIKSTITEIGKWRNDVEFENHCKCFHYSYLCNGAQRPNALTFV